MTTAAVTARFDSVRRAEGAAVLTAIGAESPRPSSAAPDLAAAINDAVRAAQQHAASAVQAAVCAGALLVQAREAIPFGEWDAWLRQHVDVAPRTARAYMQLSKRLGEMSAEDRQRVAELPLRQAMAAITTPAEAPPRATRYVPARGDVAVRPTFETAARTLGALCRDVGFRPLKRDRINGLRDKLKAVLVELDRMAEAAK